MTAPTWHWVALCKNNCYSLPRNSTSGRRQSHTDYFVEGQLDKHAFNDSATPPQFHAVTAFAPAGPEGACRARRVLTSWGLNIRTPLGEQLPHCFRIFNRRYISNARQSEINTKFGQIMTGPREYIARKILTFFFILHFPSAHAAGFDCDMAKGFVEAKICSIPELSKLDWHQRPEPF